MWFSRLFKRSPRPSPSGRHEHAEATVDQGIYYLYMIVGCQVAFVLALVGIIMLIGRVIATPMWVFLFTFLLAVSGCVYIYRKVKKNFVKLRQSLQQVNLSNRNYEISFMGGFLTMRVEQNPQQRLLEAPPRGALLDAEPVETQMTR